MKFTIVTPSFNRIDYFNEAILSVVSQEGDFEIEYIVQDGGSSTGVIELLQRWKDAIDSGRYKPACNRLTFNFHSEQDSGMYDAINKGFQKGTGDVMAWINTDDMYLPNALQTISQAFEQHSDVSWLIGQATCFNHFGAVVNYGYDPNAFSRRFILKGYYRADIPGFNWLSQDSIFWRRALWEIAGPLNTNLKLVSDFRLWQSFAKHAELVKLKALIGGYRFHGNQLTGDPGAYPSELGPRPVLPLQLSVLARLAKALSGLRMDVFHYLWGPLFQLLFGVEREDVIGRQVFWNFAERRWEICQLGIFS